MDLSALGIKHKQHRVIPVTDSNIIKDFLDGKIQVIGVECNTRGVYGSPIQKRLGGIFPEMIPHVSGEGCANKIGTTVLWRINSKQHTVRQFVANMFLTTGYGLGRSGPNRSDKPVNRFSARHLEQAFDDLISKCRQNNVQLDRTIGMQRVFGGLGGVSWQEVLTVLDALCERHQISIYVYLPKNYDTTYVRGAQ
ncbi:putative Appr-1-p processing protein [Erwinia phage vB_EamM_Yoloswag]|uniref:Putative Appr-1-p processing protein n=1 Tax=Erwinia phage vB_EamM_Yoloswag TaxID=1958956 RepID=A0A1S6L2U8_9CAUD|nr:putative Appr-1-p processing protein [Erwinia phage vB_EamM_Yoloswag]AQT28500.1 putative Appr-1-p processing protein [Erwinia phage vB_EamM_Yoloswag]